MCFCGTWAHIFIYYFFSNNVQNKKNVMFEWRQKLIELNWKKDHVDL